ncbi:sensor histidine kinase [Nonomuraea mesophila]|uniref:histidine kinase n=1 Tax=Nonomuraea mesophila TaxID=2530382 RepID=A0A4R5FUI9_9ACTN|nr:histidine kinase [Nonomuraea mesophila]TDE57171.1 sensor histidine kinase [Nonomuraea mesophila]
MSHPTLISVARRRFHALPHLRVDAALAVLITIVQLWPLISRESPQGGLWHWWGYTVAVAASVPLMWRRRAPFVVLLASGGVSTLYDLADNVADQPIWYGTLVALYTVAAYSRLGARIIAFAVTAAGGLLAVGSWETALRGTVLLVAAYAIGRAAATSRAHAAALEERAVRLEKERQMEAERAAQRERDRIARDMHDILAHAVSLMVVQAEAGPVVVRSDPARAEAAFDAIAEAGRDAMVQLRRMLGLLRDGETSRAPQPAIGDLPALAEQVAETGLRMTFDVRGKPRAVSPDCAVAAYRITQEALTNIVKHSGADHAGIRLTWEDHDLMIDITDDGRGGGRGLPSGGDGLIGIRERAAACGGTATAGPRTDGHGFAVSVRLPLARP